MRYLLTLIITLSCALVQAGNLTNKDVERWLNSAPELQKWLEKQEDKLPNVPEPDDQYDINTAMQQGIQQLKTAGIYTELDKKVKAAGYSNVEHWIAQSQQISLAYLAVILSKEVGQRAEIMAQLQELEKTDLPEANKALMKSMLEGSLAMLNAIESSTAADQKAVQPYLDKLGALIGEEE